jgi:hypothetical protein
MKLQKTANKNTIKISKSEWETIGKTAGWDKDIDVEQPGKWENYTKQELIEKRDEAKERQEKRKKEGKKADTKDTELLRELNFAIRAKGDWGKASSSKKNTKQAQTRSAIEATFQNIVEKSKTMHPENYYAYAYGSIQVYLQNIVEDIERASEGRFTFSPIAEELGVSDMLKKMSENVNKEENIGIAEASNKKRKLIAKEK